MIDHLFVSPTPTRFLKLLGDVAKGIQSSLFYPNPNFPRRRIRQRFVADTCPNCPYCKRCDAWQDM